jgi:hypothetical protein
VAGEWSKASSRPDVAEVVPLEMGPYRDGRFKERCRRWNRFDHFAWHVSGDAERSGKLTRACNEYSAQLTQDHPGRFGLFASLPLPDTAGSLEEIAHAQDVLHADGFRVMTSYEGKYLGDDSFASVFDEPDRRRAVVHVHPNGRNASMTIARGVPGQWAELPQVVDRDLERVHGRLELRVRQPRTIRPVDR